MKNSMKLSAIASAMALTLGLTACGGGGGTSSVAALDSTLPVSSGTITGFGSVYVNGVKFDTENASFDIEGSTGTQADLAIGMVVQVNGVINPDGVTGTATNIVFDDQLQGPVADFTPSADNLTATFTVLGVPVEIDSKTTYFDPDNGGITFDTIQNGDIVELSGLFRGDTLVADRIERKTETQVEFKGNITGLNNSQFTLRGISVDASTARLDDLPNGLVEGAYVEVEGAYDGTQIIATKVESEEFEYGDNNEFEMEGYVTNLNGSRFEMNGIVVDFSRAEMEPRRLQVANNLQVEVEGRFSNGVMIAEEIKMRGGDAEVSGFISRVDVANNLFEVEINGTVIVIHTGMETEFEDDYDRGIYSFRLADLGQNDFVEVEGYLNDDGSLFAVEVEVTSPDEIEVQSVVDAIAADKITVLGVDFSIDVNNTIFEGTSDNPLTQVEFENAIITGQTWVKVKDTNRDGTADKIELED